MIDPHDTESGAPRSETGQAAPSRYQRFVEAAAAMTIERGGVDFTVRDVVDRTSHSLQTFYLEFDSKDQLLMAMFKAAVGRCAEEIDASVRRAPDPVDRLRLAVESLFRMSRADPAGDEPLLPHAAPQLAAVHWGSMEDAHAPMLAYFTGLIADIAAHGLLRPGAEPCQVAAMMVAAAIFLGRASDDSTRPITVDELWSFCSAGFAAAD